jgi:hypothetical protein
MRSPTRTITGLSSSLNDKEEPAMKLKEMFDKDIERDIKGVIKIGQDDDANVFQELDEYVVTRELSRHFSTFFEVYQSSIDDYTDKMGVWISGFFGSGKSHFLKILSYLLANKEVQGKKAISYFDDKIEDPIVLADMERAGDVSTDVILFNIDSKSDTDSKTNKESIVRVFNKVFDEMQGFCGSLSWLAELERQLQKEGTYEAFQNKYAELAGKSWVESREDYYFEEDNIVKALAETTRMSIDSARRWYERGEENYSLSVEKFANKVKEYIESKGREHHVIFLVDEMGQYIGDDTGLMLNLQTVVEDLGTYCGGKAWVLVTSQQEIDTVTRVKGEDFSKILGRFNTRLSLSSANVDEVIKKRILFKNDVGRETLQLLYAGKEAILKNLITFSADTPEMKTYQTTEDFIEVYPFVPYQFRLLQSVFTAIRIHGASGKHLAEGERSLLSAFQEAALQFADCEAGTLIPFSAFYETIETFLDHNIRTVIIHAEDNERLDAADVEVLKVLFLIKWVREMPANLENLATLMVSHIDEDIIERKKKIEKSLEKLLKETLIQKNGNEYLFLTHEEQDVNREIKNIPEDLGKIVKSIGEEIFYGIYNEKKYRYNARYHFDFNKTIDDRHLNPQKNEIGVKIITPYFDTGKEFTAADLKTMSSREKSLIIKLPPDTTALEEMEDIYKIQTYLTRKGGSSVTAEIEAIKIRKAQEVVKRKERVHSLLIDALQEADFYAHSQKINLQSKNPVERISNGLRVLIDGIFNKLSYIDSFIESNKELQDILLEEESQLTVESSEDVPNKLALEEVRGYIERNTQRNIPMTMKGLLDLYSKAPYGWLDDDLRGLVLRLFKSQEITLQMAGEYIVPTDKDLVQYTLKKEYVERLKIKKRTKLPEELLQNARRLLRDVFHVAAVPDDEDGLMRRFKELSRNELSDVKELLVYYKNKNYPDKKVLEDGKTLLEAILEIKDVFKFYKKLSEVKDELLDYEENVIDVKNFFKNQQGYFDRALDDLYIYEKNKSYVLDNATMQTVKEIKDIVYAAKPYAQIPKLPSLLDTFRSRFVQLLEKEIKPVKDVIASDRKKVMTELEKYSFKSEFSSRFYHDFKDLLDRLETCNNFYEAIAMKEESDRLKLRCFEDIEKMRQEQEKEEKGPGERKPATKKVVTISIANIFHGARTLETREDVEQLLDYLREQFLNELQENTKLKLI